MIKKLSNDEIKKYECEIYKKYKSITLGNRLADEAWLINDAYYISSHHASFGKFNLPFIGMVRINDNSNNLLELHDLFLKILEKHGIIGIWRNENDARIEKLHSVISKRMKKYKQEIYTDKGINIIIIYNNK